jgi:hypothetical protein
MSRLVLDRITVVDDDGTGTVGDIIDNAFVQGLQDVVDDAIGPIVQAKTGNYTTVLTDDLITCVGTFTVGLVTAVGNGGKVQEIKNAGTGLITVDANGSETIDDELTIFLGPGEAARLRSDNANWLLVGNNGADFLPANPIAITFGVI